MARLMGSWILLALGWGLAAPAAAQSPAPIEQQLSAAQLEEIGLNPRQLALLNRYLAQAAAERPAVASATPPTPGAAPATTQDPLRFAGLDTERIESRIRGHVAGWAPGDVFALENGQRWQVLKGQMKLRQAQDNPPVVLVPGIAGRWFLQFDEDLPKARVFRVD